MKQFIANLKSNIEENPVLALAGAAALITSVAKLVDAVGHYSSRHAYAAVQNKKAGKR